MLYHSSPKKSSITFIVTSLLVLLFSVGSYAQSDTTLANTLPPAGKLKDDKPSGKGWVNLLSNASDWNFESKYWKLDKVFHGELGKEPEHHYSYTKKSYKDFELNVVIRMTGDETINSGVCVRVNPTNFDDVPGYQVDMGTGYWGCLWEERRAGMVQKFPESLAAKIVKVNDWNHYYIKVQGHHIQAWLNGVKTIDIVHESGFTEGRIGFQLCHQHSPTSVDVRSVFVREL